MKCVRVAIGKTQDELADKVGITRQTLASYEAHFGQVPPADIWPDARRRFLVDPRAVRLNPADVVILTRGQAYGVLAAIGLALAALVATAMF